MGAPRTITTAVRRSIEVARGNGGWSAAHDLTAALAVKIARQLQAAESPTDVVRLTRELQALMATLPNGTPDEPPPAAGAGEEAAGDDVDAELAAIVGARPEVGNTPYA